MPELAVGQALARAVSVACVPVRLGGAAAGVCNGAPLTMLCARRQVSSGYAPAWRGLADLLREAGDCGSSVACYQVREGRVYYG